MNARAPGETPIHVRSTTRGLVAAVVGCILLAAGFVPAAASPGVPDSPAPLMPGAVTNPPDDTKIPHYFGPYPNWANSPFTLADATVTISDGSGAGADATATVGANGTITTLTLTSPGAGYVDPEVVITGAGAGAQAVATVAESGAVSSVVVDAAGGGYRAPSVSFEGGTGTGPTTTVGNPLTDRAYATDFETNDPVRAFVIVPTPLPAGTLTEFVAWNQATAGSSPTPSAGETFNAYVLHPTGNAGEYVVVADSGALTVPALTVPATSEAVTYDVTDVAVANGDVIGFYGSGIPVDVDPAGLDRFSYPAESAPVQGATITFGSAAFPDFGQARTYSFGARVIEAAGAVPLTPAVATALGGIDAISLGNPGTGYAMPTVAIDYPDAPGGTQATAHVLCAEVDCKAVAPSTTVTITGVQVDNPGSGYSTAPGVVIRDGTLANPINGGTGATAAATLEITAITVDAAGDGYVNRPTVTIADTAGSGSGATATAVISAGAITSLELVAGGTGYVTPGGIRKFTDALPGLCLPPACPTAADAKYIPLGVPEARDYVSDGTTIEADEYVIGLVQYRTSFSSSLPDTLVRGYVQLETAANAGVSQSWPVTNELMDGTLVPVLKDGGAQWKAVTPPQWLGPTILATRNRPVRIVFYNLLPKGSDGDLFLPVDSTLMGSGMGPMTMPAPADEGTVTDDVRNPACTANPKSAACFKDNRATLHLHGGISPWISDGTPHQWITPASETTPWPQGVSVQNVPDMNVCGSDRDGCQTFYYTNQQSARLMFYHDHAWGITRLNVYASEAAGYVIGDSTEQALISGGAIPATQIPLVVQDRTFVPDDAQLALQDPTWDTARWGSKGSFWYHHVYMPAQNPGDPSGLSAFGRWMYGPWFWPPATPEHGPIANPYYDPTCDLDDPATWTYDADPFCEPELIPGTPNISVGMEQFNDTPIVNGVAYPTLTVEPRAYRFRVLNAANDRFFNFQWYEGDAATASTALNAAGQVIGPTEVRLDAGELAAAQTDPVVFPTPVHGLAGPDWIQIGTEGGFLPAPVVVNGQQPTTWITDPTRFDVGLVDQHSLLLAPAERADVIVDFAAFAGRTLILYNDAPAAFPARIASYDYYTGAPDLRPVGANSILPGYGPNTRTIMQVRVAASAAQPSTFSLSTLRNAFTHKANGSGVFESGQHPIIVGQSAYNSAYGTSFASSSNCNSPGSTVQTCDGFVRVSNHTTFGFNTLASPASRLTMPLQPKAIHDEMNATTFDEFGRMQANLGVERQPPAAGAQNVVLYPYVNPQTELIDGTDLPRVGLTFDADGEAISELDVTPISRADDGSQIWRITHNGVDTHPIHFHLFDVQVVNRVTWDNIIKPPDATELGWKDTVRVSPLEDTIVALRPVVPYVPFEIPNAIRSLSPMMELGATQGFNNTDVDGNPTATITNRLVNFAWEYVFHCHILSHEEMDMMRPVSLALPPREATVTAITPSGNRFTVFWTDNSINETSFTLQRSTNGITWVNIGTVQSPLDQPNVHGQRSMRDTSSILTSAYLYRVVAANTAGYGGAFPSLTAQSYSAPMGVNRPTTAPAAPTSLTATLQTGPQARLQWVDNASNESGFVIERAPSAAGPFVRIAVAAARTGTGPASYVDTTIAPGTPYWYRVAAVNLSGVTPPTYSAFSNVATTSGSGAVPSAPSNLLAANGANLAAKRSVILTWTDTAGNETGFTIQRATNAAFTTGLTTSTVAANATTATQGQLNRATTYYFRIRADNAVGSSAWTNATPFPIITNP